MNNDIIAQFIKEYVEKFLGEFSPEKFKDIGSVIERLQSLSNDYILKITSAVIDQMDLEVKKSVIRKSEKLKVKESNVERSFVTAAGNLSYKRTYYQTKNNDFVYLIDYILGVEEYERIDKSLIADLVNLSLDMSFQKAIDARKVELSKQTLNNKFLAIDELAVDIKEEKIRCKEIHIFVDEGHVSEKTPLGKRRVQAPLVVVSTGIDVTNEKRHVVKDPLYLASYGMSSQAFFNNLYAIVDRKYDLDHAKVYVHADGGTWIKQIKDYFLNCTFVMDEFHLNKYIKKLSHYCENGELQSLRNYLRYNDQDGFDSGLNTVRARIADKIELQKFYDIRKYFRNNWESINERLTRGVCGSCTEPMVSHLFASRISRTPCAWTSHGLSNMTMLRSYVANGGKVESSDIKVTRDFKREEDRRKKLKSIGIEKYNDYLMASTEKNQKEIRDIFYNEKIDYVIDVTGGVQQFIKIISQETKTA